MEKDVGQEGRKDNPGKIIQSENEWPFETGNADKTDLNTVCRDEEKMPGVLASKERGPMTGDDKIRMQDAKKTLIGIICNPQPIIDYLDGEGILVLEDKEKLDQENSPTGKVATLIELLINNCRGSYVVFLKSLYETGYSVLAHMLEDNSGAVQFTKVATAPIVTDTLHKSKQADSTAMYTPKPKDIAGRNRGKCTPHSKMDTPKPKDRKKDKNEIANSKIDQAIFGDMINQALHSSRQVLMPADVKLRNYHCEDCSVQFDNLQDRDNHSNTSDHKFNVEADKVQQWNFRQPPWNKDFKTYQLCSKTDCTYTHVPEQFNYCQDAHGQPELNEWKERYTHRQMKRNILKDNRLMLYTDNLMRYYTDSLYPDSVLCEEGIAISCNKDLNVKLIEKKLKVSWIFTVNNNPKLPVKRICLLLNRDRHNFYINTSTDHLQVQFMDDTKLDQFKSNSFTITVNFRSFRDGYFKQWIVFDFGIEPAIVRKLSVETCHKQQLIANNPRSEAELWTKYTREIITDPSLVEEEFTGKLLTRYKQADEEDKLHAFYDREFPLNRYNYQHKMHKLLYSEEQTRRNIIARYNLVTKVTVKAVIEDETVIFAQAGELFAKICLMENLSEDTDEGRLFLESVQGALIKRTDAPDKRVYEVGIARRDTFSGLGKDYIYLELHPTTVKQLKLQPDTDVEMEVQFQMNRGTFCRMHYAIDSLSDVDIVFPNLSKLNVLNWNEHERDIAFDKLNGDQTKAVKHMVTKKDYSPPLIVYGPFGTGKTETLAEATKYLFQYQPQSRILICTYTNSAADIYYIKYLGDILRQSEKFTALRIYAPNRRLNTVPTECRPYILFSEESGSFYIPTQHHFRKTRIVITTVETAIYLTTIDGIRGFFSHIFLDEAAQFLECQALMPLTLADAKTCIVLAGDHRQMNPKIYSSESKRQMFGRSILVRLHTYYERYCKERKQSYECISIFLNQNYRSHCQLLKFISATFYGNEDHLICISNLPNISLNPINFFSVSGKEVHTNDSTSFYNEEEADAIVNGISYILNNWPKEWGERDPEDIQVVAPYSQQVARIRSKLRMKNLRYVHVARIYNIQGQQFRVLFISTVRTLELCEGDHMKKCLQGLEDVNMGEYGFLSEPNMINTALTRAQSLVAVVGDPIALCTVGECSGIWKTYIKQCHKLDSLSTLSYKEIKQAVEERESSPLGAEIRKLSERSLGIKQEDSKVDHSRPVQPAILRIDHQSGSEIEKTKLSAWGIGERTRNIFTNSTLQQITPKPVENDDYDDWDDFIMNPDEIIQKLGEKLQCPTSNFSHLTQEKSTDKKKDRQGTTIYKVKEENGRAVLYPVSTNKSKRVLLTANDGNDNPNDSSEDEDEDTGASKFRKEFKREYLKKQLQEHPEKYKHCILHSSSECKYATVVDFTSTIKEIKIRSQRSCGRAFDNDEVVVEILPNSAKYKNILCEDKPVEIYGEVVGILRRALNPRLKNFVCRTIPTNTRLMIPINLSVPPIWNLELIKVKGKGHKRGKVVVYKFQNKTPEFDQYEENPTGKLFLVKYLKWKNNWKLPLGIVIDVQPLGHDIETGMSIINHEHHIQMKFNDKLIQTYEHSEISKDKNTLDFTEAVCFTIDSSNSQDLNNALSIEKGYNGTFTVGIHIADVSHFVDKDSNLDKVAYKRGTSYYPIGTSHIPMLPPTFSMSMCSLLPNVDRRAMSVLLKVKVTGEIITGEVCKSIIRSKKQFNYDEVQSILNRSDATDDISCSVKLLADIARKWRTTRMGQVHLLDQADFGHSMAAHLMVAEFMIMANHQLASLLLNKFPQCCPLRIQRLPDDYKLDIWRGKYFNAVSNLDSESNVAVPFRVLLLLCDSVDSGDRESFDWQRFVQLLLSLENYSRSATALATYRSIEDESFYICSANIDPVLYAHYRLNLWHYTHATSPIRRYFDIVLHRMLSACISNTEPPYSESELVDIAYRSNIASLNSKSYDKSIFSLHLSVALEERPLVCYPIIESVDEMALTLVFPNIACLSLSQRKIDMRFLAPSERPSTDDNDVTVKLQWKERIYNVNKESSNMETPIELKEPIKSVDVPGEQWQSLLSVACRNNPENIISEFHKEFGHMFQNYPESLTTELRVNDKLEFFRNFFIRYRADMHVKVQLAPVLKRGLLVPQIQLYFLTEKHIICMEHRQDPIRCFSVLLGSRPASKRKYRSPTQYTSLWLPVLAMEAVTSSVRGQEQIFIHGVQITWCENFGTTKSNTSDIGSLNVTKEGTFELTAEFCKERNIKLHKSDYVCVRYNDIDVPILDDLDDQVGVVANHHDKICFVCHCVINKIEFNQIHLKLYQHSMPFPRVLIDRKPLSSIEIIPKSLPDRRSQQAVEMVDNIVTPLTVDICLGNTPSKIKVYTDLTDLLGSSIPVDTLIPLNLVQTHATRTALSEPFTLIHGPPGTGKTITGVYLAYYFCKRNSFRKDVRNQLLYCGPSNKSVDVVAEKLLSLKESCPNIIRVYSERIEQMEFPLPRNSILTTKRPSTEVSKNPALKNRSLHHLIRAADSPYSTQIKEFDRLFQPSIPDDVNELVDMYIALRGLDNRERENLKQNIPDIKRCVKEELQNNIPDEEIDRYRILINKAKGEELKKPDIILCTCVVSGSPILKKCKKIEQIIIDESGMCTEPETMIPLTSFSATNIVLIGDHKQLQPVIQAYEAKQLGLQKSLFERYADDSKMLNEQYRMHEGIMEFPSTTFYDGKLECGEDKQKQPVELDVWPRGRSLPTVLCHTEGDEETLTVATEDGSAMSKSNPKEVEYAVCVAINLVKKWNRKREEIVIMSPYRAQCSTIKSALKDCELPEINVSTVVASQGSEWEYVILSTVRSLPEDMLENDPPRSWISQNLGFIADDHQLNVAITRAKLGLIIIGNTHLLKCDPTWKKLTEHYAKRGLLVDAEKYPLCRIEDKELDICT